MKSDTIRVLCVDDHAFLGDALRARLALEGDMEFVGWLGGVEQMRVEVDRLAPTVVLLDIEMPGGDPFEALADLKRSHPDVRVMMLSAYVKDHYLDTALKAGAWGYLSKSDPPETVIDAIRAVGRGEFVFGPSVLERCQPRIDARTGRPIRPTASKQALLTPREVQILRMIGRGLARTEIAESLCRSPKTVDNHRAAIMDKLEIRTSVELVRYAIREGFADV